MRGLVPQPKANQKSKGKGQKEKMKIAPERATRKPRPQANADQNIRAVRSISGLIVHLAAIGVLPPWAIPHRVTHPLLAGFSGRVKRDWPVQLQPEV
jgi:hypothetical protein